ncbi:Uncharacterised protein [Mycobacterium tuberculosis]|nr:Uncharacterised protein [Mycobacterium tuberculosis]
MRQAQAAEVDEGDLPPVDVELGLFELAVRQGVETGKQTQLVEQAQGDRVHGVAAKITKEVGVLLEHGDFDAGASQQQPEDHSGRATAGDGAGGGSARGHGHSLYWPAKNASISGQAAGSCSRNRCPLS